MMPPTDIIYTEDGQDFALFVNDFGHYAKSKYNTLFYSYYASRDELEAYIVSLHGPVIKRINKDTVD